MSTKGQETFNIFDIGAITEQIKTVPVDASKFMDNMDSILNLAQHPNKEAVTNIIRKKVVEQANNAKLIKLADAVNDITAEQQVIISANVKLCNLVISVLGITEKDM